MSHPTRKSRTIERRSRENKPIVMPGLPHVRPSMPSGFAHLSTAGIVVELW